MPFLSIFTSIKNPMSRGDAYTEALDCYQNLADEVVIMNGGQPIQNFNEYHYDKLLIKGHLWPKEFSWPFIGEQFTRGYQACSGDWVIHADLDMIFHQNDFGRIRQALKDYPDSPAVSFFKWQFVLPDRYNLKSRLPLAVNKNRFGDRIKFNGGGDLCQPTLDGEVLELNEIPQARVPFYNYEKLIKTKEQIMDDQGRMERAYYRHFGRYQLAKDDSDKSAYEGWLRMSQGRFNKPSKKIPLSDHPKYIQETIKNLTPEMWGYNGFGLIKGGSYAQ